MIGQEMVSELYDCEVFDVSGEKIGSVKQVWVDDHSGVPIWASVHSGLFGMKESFVPLQSANMREHEVRVAVDKERIKNSPKVDASSDHISDDEQAQLLRYYGFGPQRTSSEGMSGQQAGQHTSQATAQSTTPSMPRASATDQGVNNAQPPATGRTSAARPRADAASTAGTEQTAGMKQSGEHDARHHADGSAMTRSEEHLRVRTERVETGKVRLVKHVVTEEQQVTIPLSHEEVRIVREPITADNRDRAMTGQDIAEAQHEVILHAEKPIVDKETVPVERIRLDTEEVTETETVTGRVRKEVVDVQDDTKKPPKR